METRTSGPVRHIHTAQQRYDVVGTLDGIVSGRYVERGLPVLVPSVYVRLVAKQDLNSILEAEDRMDKGKPQNQK